MLLLAFLTACSDIEVSGPDTGNMALTDSPAAYYEPAPGNRYASGFSLDHNNGQTLITVYNPWDSGKVLRKYLLTRDNGENTENLADSTVIIRLPVKKVGALSATHLGMLEMLGRIDKVIAVCDAPYIYHPVIRNKIKEGIISEVGELQTLNIEKLIELSPDLVLLTGWDNVSNTEKRLEEFGLPLVYNIEWMEKTPLGRAEWLRFVAAFFNEDKKADSIFSSVVHNYNRLKSIAAGASVKPSVLHGSDYEGTWFVPGGKSYIGILYRD
ncbi:MAG: ABC transporter substrate-binding protein, partial [Bacteroidetes bacterium]|nr:ABC transporter substrate-binding protein [Bacteroidota bacterium]